LQHRAVAALPAQIDACVTETLERVADVPIYSADALVRRATSLQLTADARAPRAALSRALWERLGLGKDASPSVRVRQDQGSAVLPAYVDYSLSANCVRVSAGHIDTVALREMFGPITVERA